MALLRLLAIVVFIEVVAFASIAGGADWTLIRPTVTTESELISVFGNPTEVTASFLWEEWSAKWKKRPKSSSYVLRYGQQESKSQLLVGPGGPADDAEVHIVNGKVFSVVWHYGGPPARSAVETLGADPQFAKGSPESTYRIGKHMPHGFLSGILASNGTQVELRYELK